VAQSPDENAASSDVLRYDLGWKAINNLLRQGRSLSGQERNCCFLNLGQEKELRFADVSAAIGLDYPDDGRVLALSDWDFDGDLDFWIANRSGPQVRFLRNDFRKPESGFIAFYLRGIISNKDAIGSRVTITMDDGRIRSETLRAGEGYLSQSSKWLHFGTGTEAKVSTVKIRWPNGKEQALSNLETGQRYLVTEGKEGAQPWKTPRFKALAESPLNEPPLNDTTRIILLAPLPLPDLEGLTQGVKKARLINLWASWCPACPIELSDWGKSATELKKAGLEILAVNVDEKEDRAHWEVLDLPFEYRFGNEGLVTKFDVIQRAILSRQRPLPVPCSFLIDAAGRLRAIYKGPVSAEQLLSDLRLIDGRAEETLAAASPLPGRWGQPPGGSSPQQIVIKFLEGGFTEDARNYLEALIQDPETKTVGLLNLLGGIYLDQQEFSKAAAVFRSALALDPNDRKAHLELGTLFLAAKQGSLAEVHFSKILTTTPNDPDLLQQLGRSFLFQGELDSAREAFEKARTLADSSGLQASLVELATSYFDAGNLDQASDALELVPPETSGAEALRERLGSARPEK